MEVNNAEEQEARGVKGSDFWTETREGDQADDWVAEPTEACEE